jgi:hypothetical protein
MIETLKTASIRIDGDTQLRLETDRGVIQSYAQDMIDGDVFPPVVVFHDGTNLWLSDGFHRFFATLEAGRDEILADVRRGARRDALLHAVEANRKHGLSLTNNDKRRIVTMLLNDPEWGKWSDREIARRCGVSHPFVSSLRSSLETVTSERSYITKYGSVATMNVARIGNFHDGLPEYVIRELEERNVSTKDIADIARYARELQADVRHNAACALLIGSWMLSCKEGDTPRIGDPPYTQEQLEKEGWEVWCLHPTELGTFFEIGGIEQALHKTAVANGKEYCNVTKDDLLETCDTSEMEMLARCYTTVRLRSCYSIWHYHTFGLSEETKKKLRNGEIASRKEAYDYDRQEWDRKYKERHEARKQDEQTPARQDAILIV